MADPDEVRGTAPSRRLRISAWTDPTVFMNGSKKDVTLKDGTVVKDVFVPDMKNLFKKDALKNEVLSGQPNGFRVLDDISLLVTLRDDNTSQLNPVFHPGFLAVSDSNGKLDQAASNKLRKTFYQQVIAHCHDVLGVQCLVGYEQKDLEKNANGVEPALATWLKMPNPSPSINTVTDNIVAFCEDNLPGYDGISFDLEGLGGAANQLPAATANMAAFYQQLARKICSPPFLPNPRKVDPGFDRLIALASGNLIGVATDGKMKSSRLLMHDPKDKSRVRDANGDYVTNTTIGAAPLTAGFLEQAQDYSLGTADRNLIIRPMSYDNFRLNDPPQNLDDWHADIVRFMKTFPTATFQLGVKTIDGEGQTKRGMDGVMKAIGHVQDRCRDLLNPMGIGLCFFPTSQSFWKDANEALNPTVREAGRLLGHPTQCPLSLPALAVLNKTTFPSP